MKLRDALKEKGWEIFVNTNNEAWNTSDLLLQVLEGESPKWLDAECTVGSDYIIDCFGDELTEKKGV